MKQHQRREKELLQELQNPGREKHGRSIKSKRIGGKYLDETSHTPKASPLEGLDYHPKFGSKLDRSECMIIVSVGNEHPSNVRVQPKDEVRARQAVNVHGRLPDIVGLPLGTEVDLNVISGLIRAAPRVELTDLQLDITGYQRSREYYLQAIRNFFTRCKQPGGESQKHVAYISLLCNVLHPLSRLQSAIDNTETYFYLVQQGNHTPSAKPTSEAEVPYTSYVSRWI